MGTDQAAATGAALLAARACGCEEGPSDAKEEEELAVEEEEDGVRDEPDC